MHQSINVETDLFKHREVKPHFISQMLGDLTAQSEVPQPPCDE